MAKTYVLAGYDDPKSGAFTEGLKSVEGRDDVVIIRPKPGQSISDAIGAHSIAAGDKVLIASHGAKDGGFEWNKGEIIPYGAAFANLPEGLSTIAVASCYGELAQNDLKWVPKGTMLQTMVGSEMVNISTNITQFFKESGKQKEGAKQSAIIVDTMLEALDNVDPQEIAAVAKRENEQKNRGFATDPNKVLPHTVGIGGYPPKEINLNNVLTNLKQMSQDKTLDEAALEKAAVRVMEKFDADKGGKEEGGLLDQGKVKLQVMQVAAKIQRGETLESIEEKRIGYGLAIAYVEATGHLDGALKEAQASMPSPQQEHVRAQYAQEQDTASIQTFLNDMKIPGADGKPLTVDGIEGGNTRYAFEKFCRDHGIDPQDKAEFKNIMQAYKNGTLTKQELTEIREADKVLDQVTVGMTQTQLSAIREEFADLRGALMGKDNAAQVKEEIGQLVAVAKQAMHEQDTARGR